MINPKYAGQDFKNLFYENEEFIKTKVKEMKNEITIKYIGSLNGKLGVGTKKIKHLFPNLQHVRIK